ncbi:MAG: hypothetical protein IH598_10190 [Bacteroidales bacterium]|nr:hypothetical protein [Bacteroidales bacterium]
MTNKFTFLTPVMFIMLITLSLMITSCTKEGPQGPPGLDGQDATETCMTCHDFSETIVTKFTQYSYSTHASGNNVDRNGVGCSQCHTSQGFRSYLVDGVSVLMPDPTPINCRTCHPIHESYSTDDYAVRTNAPVNLIVGDFAYDYGNSNLCANCHQARSISPYPIAGGDDVTITNARYGPHYGPQSNMIAGKGPFEIPGSLPYENSAHTSLVTDGCVTCHLAPASNLHSGGHQMNVSYTTSSGATAFNYSGCTSCHTSATELAENRAEKRAEIEDLKAQLLAKLQEKGLLNASELVPQPITVSPNEAGAIINYKFVYGDHSYGAHNYLYTKALLVNSLEALN